MSELSELLKNRREELGKTKSTVCSDTKIRESFLTSIEEGDYKALPSYLHAYGFVKNYAKYLGFSQEEIKVLFDAECPKAQNISLCEGDSIELEPKKGSGKKALILLVIFIVICLIGWYGYGKIYNKQKESVPVEIVGDSAPASDSYTVPEAEKPIIQSEAEETSATKPIQNNDNTSVTVPLEQTPASVQPLPNVGTANQVAVAPEVPAIQPAIDNTVKYINLTFTGDCWVKFTPDTGDVIDFVATAGSTRRLGFISGFTINIGNAAAISMKYGRQNFTNFGSEGIPLIGLRYSLTDGVLSRTRNR